MAEGDVLKIPQNAAAFPGDRALKAHPAQYTVGAGDTIYSIACAYGDVSPEMIVAANALAAPYTLTSGSVLQIP
jgi:LysM repeat protein